MVKKKETETRDQIFVCFAGAANGDYESDFPYPQELCNTAFAPAESPTILHAVMKTKIVKDNAMRVVDKIAHSLAFAIENHCADIVRGESRSMICLYIIFPSLWGVSCPKIWFPI